LTEGGGSPGAGELRAQIRLASALALGHLGQQLMGLVDTAMLGRFSDTALAGAGIANSILFSVTVFGIGVVMGLDTLVPQAFGANERGRARTLLHQGVHVAVLVGVPLTLLAGLLPMLLPAVDVDPEVSQEAAVYVYARLPAIVPFLIFTALRSYLQSRDATRPIVVAMIAGNIVNLIADAVLIYGDATLVRVGLPAVGLPAMGVIGAAIATTVVSIATTVILALSVRKLRVDQPVERKREPRSIRSILSLGTPVGLQLVAEVGIFATTAVMAGTMGKIPAAAHQVAITLASFTFSIVVGVGAATSVRVGRAIGARDVAGTRRAGTTGMAVGVTTMSCSAILFLVFPAELARLFTDDPVVVAASVPLLRIAAVFQISDGLQAVAAGALRGAGDTRFTVVANVIGHYGVGLPVALVLGFALDMGAAGLWWALSCGLTVTAAGLVARFLWLSARPIARS
jgi:MATE family multidrug resistance protein